MPFDSFESYHNTSGNTSRHAMRRPQKWRIFATLQVPAYPANPVNQMSLRGQPPLIDRSPESPRRFVLSTLQYALQWVRSGYSRVDMAPSSENRHRAQSGHRPLDRRQAIGTPRGDAG